jgi:adenosine deaminase
MCPVSWYAAVPKIELHLHLEGAIPLAALWELMRKYDGRRAVPSLEALQARFRYRDFPTFIDTWVWKNGFLREYDDFELIARAVAEELGHQQIRYAELFFSPGDFARHGLTTQKLATSIRRGLDRVPTTQIRLIADLIRDFGPEQATRTLAEAHEVRREGVIGVGLGGSEQTCPAPPFAPVYARARQLGLHTTAHGGEAAGAESVWAVIRDLKAERVGHGTRAVDDPTLLQALAERQIPLEVCPTSNVATGTVKSFADHPIRRFVDAGLLVTVATDDPAMFNTTLALELERLETELGFSRAELRQLILNGINASFLAETDKSKLRLEFQQDPAWMAPG